MMVQSHSDLDQPLKKFLFLIGRRAPHVLQHLVCVKKLSAIEQLYPAPEPVHIHAASISDHEQRRNFIELTAGAEAVFDRAGSSPTAKWQSRRALAADRF